MSSDLLGILNWTHDQYLRNQISFRNLLDPTRAVASVLPYYSMQFGLPIPNFCSTTNLRSLASKAAYINSMRHTKKGWETFLSTILGSTIVVSITMVQRFSYQFGFGLLDRQFANVDMMQTAGATADLVPYLSTEAIQARIINLTITGIGQTTEYQSFVKATAVYFIPMIDDTPLTTINYTFA